MKRYLKWLFAASGLCLLFFLSFSIITAQCPVCAQDKHRPLEIAPS